MKYLIALVMIVMICITPGQLFAQNTLVIYASQGNLNDIIEADTLADGSQAHNVYELVSLDTTYKFTGTITATDDIAIVGVVDPGTNRPPCIQPAVLPDASIPGTLFNLNGKGINCSFENLYLLAVATNNTAAGGGIAFNVTAENVRLTVDNCIFDGWQNMGIVYNAHWCDFFITNSNFRNMVHPNQHYIGEVIRNAWPNTAYTDTLSMEGNTMLCINGYAAAPVMVAYTTYFEFNDNKVLYTFKNPLHCFNATDAKINDNVFYGTYVGGVDQAENPWWDNLWSPDTSYGVIHMDVLSLDNAKMFCPEDSTDPDIQSIAESRRTVEVKNNTYYWPTEVTDFWEAWNDTASNWVYTPSWMSDRAADMFADDETWPGLIESGNVNSAPDYMDELNPDILNGSELSNDVGVFDYFVQIRNGTAATDVWGYGITQVSDAEDWTPEWPLPEESSFSGVDQKPNSTVPHEFALNKIFPNPFNPSSTVKYTLNKSGVINLKVYNVIGQNVMTLVDNEYQTANTYEVSVDMSRFTSGMYFCVLKQGDNIAVKKMMLLK
ncbi:MAG: T9SS type A sorting domain-containing protein [bacterium]